MLKGRLNSVDRARQPGMNDVQMISILSGKGGVGKSIISFNLAERSASLGLRTLLVDADFTSGNLHILAALKDNGGLAKFVTDQASLHDSVTRYSVSFDILTSGQTGPIEGLETITSIARFIKELREQANDYDLIILDHASGVTNRATVLASASDLSVVVAVPELTSISDAYGLCKYLYQTSPSIDCRLLLNRVKSDDEAAYIKENLTSIAEKFLGREPGLVGAIPEETTVREAVSRQCPLVQIDPHSSVTRVLEAFAEVYFLKPVTSRISTTLEKINLETVPADKGE